VRFGADTLENGLLLTLANTIYAILYLPEMLGSFPRGYRPKVQMNMRYVAETIAAGGNPYTPPYPEYYSTAGGHLHGVLGAPFAFLFNFPAASRIGVLLLGIGSLILFYTILRAIDISKPASLFSTAILLLYPQYIYVHTQGNPAAADIFFGCLAVSTYLRWRADRRTLWLILSSISAGAATFSHFYAGVVAVGIITHYSLTETDHVPQVLEMGVLYSLAMIPAALLLFIYTFVFPQADPGHYFDRLLIFSFDSVYASERVFGDSFSVFSIEFLYRVIQQHGDTSPIFGYWWLTTATAITIGVGSYLDARDSARWLFVWSWIFAGLLIVVILPGGVIYHDYYTRWLLMGVMAGIALTLDVAYEELLKRLRTNYTDISMPG
jgi:4-amino-4-deoxy-L-arabinose transferase-like glycosyltransferase